MPIGIIGEVVVAKRSRSGRRWQVAEHDTRRDRYLLVPLGADVRAAQDEHGRMQGGVRRIWRDADTFFGSWLSLTT